MKYVLALDQGTTSSRAVLVDEQQNIVGFLSREFEQIYPKDGWVEHDPTEIWASQYGVMMELIAKSGVAVGDIAAIGITNQRETTVVWDKNTGVPVYNAIVWQCRRTAEDIRALSENGYGELVREKTGLIPDAYFSASKIKWILDHVEGARARAERGELLFGTVDSWLIWKLTKGKRHVTDKTNASRTMLFNIETETWDDELLRLFTVPRAMLHSVQSSGDIFGYAELGGVEIPIAGVAGDQQAALFGQGCLRRGEAKNTYGTGCFLLMNTGNERPVSRNGVARYPRRDEKGTKNAVRVRGQRVYRRCGHSMVARGNALFHGEQGMRNITRKKCPIRAAYTSCRRSRAWARPIGICMRAARFSALRAVRGASISFVRRRRVSPINRRSWCSRWNGIRG